MHSNIITSQTQNSLKIAFDVGKLKLDFYSEFPTLFGTEQIKGDLNNKPNEILKLLREIKEKGLSQGFSSIQVICEPTGIYHRQLLKAADLLGLESALVSGEATHRGKIFAKNTRNKSDLFDPQVILKVASIAPLIQRRNNSEQYEALKELGRLEETARTRLKRLRTELKEIVFRVFPAFPMGEDFMNKHNGEAIFKAFACDPRKMLQLGEKKFEERYRKFAIRVRKDTIHRLWNAALESKELLLSQAVADVYNLKIAAIYQDIKTEEKRAETAMENMHKIIKHLRENGEFIPKAHQDLFTEEWIARIIAESGCLSDFGTYQQFEKYAGMNLCENQSGIKAGRIKMDKKGSSHLRRLFADLAFKLCTKRNCYGKYYHNKKEKNMLGKKSMMAVARKLLKAFYGMAKNKTEFNLDRLQLSLSEFNAKNNLPLAS